jgi:hypothetical protein
MNMRKMTSLILQIVCVLLVVSVRVESQNKVAPKPCSAGLDVPLSSGDPTVYLTYDHDGDQKTPDARLLQAGTPEESSKSNNIQARRGAKFLWLRIHNNTPWTIGFPTESLYIGAAITAWHLCGGVGVLGLRDGLEVNACYLVDTTERNGEMPPRVPGRIDVVATSWLPPGRSVIFQVPQEYVSEKFSVYLPFNYEWETENRHVRGGEPEHRAYFYARMLPASSRPGQKDKPPETDVRTKIVDIRVRGAAFFGEEKALRILGLHPGATVPTSAIEKGAGRLRDKYLKEGFLRVNLMVDDEASPKTGEQTEAKVIINVEEGPQYTIARIEFDGNKRTAHRMAERATGLRLNDPYDARDIPRWVHGLNRLHKFQQLTAKDVEVVVNEDTHDVYLTFHVTER